MTKDSKINNKTSNYEGRKEKDRKETERKKKQSKERKSKKIKKIQKSIKKKGKNNVIENWNREETQNYDEGNSDYQTNEKVQEGKIKQKREG